MEGELIHRLDVEALRHPSGTEYDNLGGNSLWPAPEGGPFAFNYPPQSERWYVQDGIAKTIPQITLSDGGACVDKRILLLNRKGIQIDVNYRRVVSSPDTVPGVDGYALKWLCYHTEDSFAPNGNYSEQEVLLAPWSLEQFPGAEGIVAFGRAERTGDIINSDFYGDPTDRITGTPYGFAYRLGGEERQQIGVKIGGRPRMVGALDTQRSLLLLRKTRQEPGLYFNIADNEQPAGPLSASDLYSIFNGGDLGFYELETIGAMNTADGCLAASALYSETLMLKGHTAELLRYLSEREGAQLELAMI
ncbi:MAG: hypothetical protein BWX80_03733 [Candidatus Hydrogenedentes bacterium ADurb.Bin101]|nr:MAG: hypothetical protein BWX80_03733 [Candidatus Hydrogenedentes bacterium ADurb.Bin101]